MKEFSLDDELEDLRALKEPHSASGNSAVTSSDKSDVKSVNDQIAEAAADSEGKGVRIRALQTQEKERIHTYTAQADCSMSCLE